jgi:CheY-like chemotaxis protein/DNA-directed RNA polymerase specialized sigma24 family protein
MRRRPRYPQSYAKQEETMSSSQHIAPYLPFLRRYARALTGNQQSGDAYVIAMLEAFVQDPPNFEDGTDIRVELYKTFTSLWESVSLNVRPTAAMPQWEASARRHLAILPPRAQEAFLLLAVEGFSKPQIGHILGMPDASVDKILEDASTSLMSGVATDILIIEDEPIIAMDLETLMESMGHRITGIARTEKEALKLAATHRPGLILADVQLADGSSGMDAANKLLSNFQVPVVFITAYPERLLTGDKPEPAFLITKPFMPEMVKAIVSQAMFFDTRAKAAA